MRETHDATGSAADVVELLFNHLPPGELTTEPETLEELEEMVRVANEGLEILKESEHATQ